MAGGFLQPHVERFQTREAQLLEGVVSESFMMKVSWIKENGTEKRGRRMGVRGKEPGGPAGSFPRALRTRPQATGHNRPVAG